MASNSTHWELFAKLISWRICDLIAYFFFSKSCIIHIVKIGRKYFWWIQYSEYCILQYTEFRTLYITVSSRSAIGSGLKFSDWSDPGWESIGLCVSFSGEAARMPIRGIWSWDLKFRQLWGIWGKFLLWPSLVWVYMVVDISMLLFFFCSSGGWECL